MPATLVLNTDDDTLELDLSTCSRGFEFTEALNKARDITGRRFDYDRKLWCYPATADYAERIIATIKPTVSDELRAWVMEARQNAEADVLTPLPEDAEVQVPWGYRRLAWQPEVVNDEPFNGLFPFQRAAVDHMARFERAILADDMGLGKTLGAISTVEEWRLRHVGMDGMLPDGPKLVVAPKSTLGGWVRELSRWLEPGTFGVQMIDGTTAQSRHNQLLRAINDGLWIITNWESVQVTREKVEIKRRSGAVSKAVKTVMKEPLYQLPWVADMELSLDDLDWRAVEKLSKLSDQYPGWLAVIADEVHRAKNRNAKRTQGLWRVQSDHVQLGLTGTPIMNSPDELWAILKWLWPVEYTSYTRFYNEYVDYYETMIYGYRKAVVTGVKNPGALRHELKDRVIRRTSGEVRPGQPGRRRIYFPVDLTPAQQKAYDDAEKEMWLEITKDVEEGKINPVDAEGIAQGEVAAIYRIPNGAARVVRLKQIIENVALLGGDDSSALMDDFEDRYEDSRPTPWVVFCEFKGSCHLLAERLRRKFDARVAVYTGEQTAAERTDIENAFQAGNLDVIVGTIGALKEGITLTRSNLEYFLSRDWVPDNNEQCEAREDRIGQTKQVMVYIPQATDTVATGKIEPTNRTKERIVRAVLPKDAIEEVHHT